MTKPEPIQLLITDPTLIAAIKEAAASGRATEVRAHAKSLRRLDTLAARIYQWLEEHGHGTMTEIARALNADISATTRASKELLQADQCEIKYEKHQDAIGQRRTRLRVMQTKRMQCDLSTPRKLQH